MPAATYAYKVRDKGGKIVEGSLDADSQNAVVGRLREMGYTPLAIVEQKEKLGKKEFTLPWKNKIKPKEVAVMSRQFATMINSGLSLLRSLNILSEQTDNKKFAAILSEARADVEKA